MFNSAVGCGASTTSIFSFINHPELEVEAIDGDKFKPWSEPWYEQYRKALGESVCTQVGIYPIPESMVLSVVIPVYNEQSSLRDLVGRVVNVPIRKEIILVDDGSQDDSVSIAKTICEQLKDSLNDIRLIQHPLNQGKGAAIKTGFQNTTGDIVIVQDADLEYDPREFPALIRPIVENKADVVYGSRFMGDHPHRVLYFWHYLGNKFLTTLSNCFTNLNLSDMETCYKVFRREVIQEIAPRLKQPRFGIEPEITARIARRKYRIYEISISYSGRTYEEGKKIGWRDGVQAIWCIVRYGLFD